MKVFKFGGASVKDADSMRNVASILEAHRNEEVLTVISALGKTTNALEEVVKDFFDKKKDSAIEKIKQLKQQHLQIAQELIPDTDNELYKRIEKLFEDLGNTPGTLDTNNYDLLYDQLVSFGELLSTIIVYHYLLTQGLPAYWLDARTVIKTDAGYREAKINWRSTEELVNDKVAPLLKDKIVITQGFIGSTSNNYTTTLGREGSDFTAAIFSNILNAEELCIWKDVPGVLNANPQLFNDTVKIHHLPYREAIEMTFYGAQVIHPKTIKPLQNKGIPLHVRSFISKEEVGTLINSLELSDKLPPIIVYKEKQLLLEFITKDFSFMAEENLSLIYEAFAKLRISINMMQNAAISLSVCIDYNEDKLRQLLATLEPHFNITVNKDARVLTIRHYNDDIVKKLTDGHQIMITQKGVTTIQFVMA